MTIKAVIIDDNIADIIALEKTIENTTVEIGCEIQIERYTEPNSALNSIQTAKTSNMLIFVDVMMPAINGTELIPLLREKTEPGALFVLMSSQHAYIKEGYSVEAFDFLCKPVSQDDVISVLRRAIGKFRTCEKGYLIVYSDKTNHKIEYSEILAVTVERNYATLTAKTQRFCFRTTVRQLMERLPEQFVQVSGNTIVNILRVTSISRQSVTMRKDGLTFDISKAYFGRILEAFRSFN